MRTTGTLEVPLIPLFSASWNKVSWLSELVEPAERVAAWHS